MITKHILDSAKAFLCWEILPDISVQLIETPGAVSYYYPPFSGQTIVIFYEKGNDDYTVPLYLLFHEAGHSLQYREMTKNGTESLFHTLINIPAGPERVAFEAQSWKIGKELLTLFMAKHDINSNILLRYENFAQKSIRTYT